MIVAINKVDLPAADAMRVKQELLQHSVNVEDFGGDVLSAEVSAKTGQGVDDLLEKVLLQAEMLELKANPDRDAAGTVIEAQLDVGKGPVVSVLVQKGTLRVGDSFICGLYDGRVRAMLDERGHNVEEAGPSPRSGAGPRMRAASRRPVTRSRPWTPCRPPRSRRTASASSARSSSASVSGASSSATSAQLIQAGQVSTLPLVIKGDVDGSVQALSDALEQLGTSEVQVEIIHRGVGAINESDVLLGADLRKGASSSASVCGRRPPRDRPPSATTSTSTCTTSSTRPSTR